MVHLVSEAWFSGVRENEITRKTTIWKEGVNYQYQIEMVTSDEKTLNMRLSSSLTDFTKAKISGKKINLTTTILRLMVIVKLISNNNSRQRIERISSLNGLVISIDLILKKGKSTIRNNGASNNSFTLQDLLYVFTSGYIQSSLNIFYYRKIIITSSVMQKFRVKDYVRLFLYK